MEFLMDEGQLPSGGPQNFMTRGPLL